MYRLLFSILALGILVVGCSSSSGQPAPTATAGPIATAKYSDTTFNFSFRYPRGWQAAARGHVETASGAQTYVIPVTIPGNKAQIEVTVDGRGGDFPSFQDGLVSSIPGDPIHHLRFYHRRTSGWPSMYIQRFSSAHLLPGNLTETDTITNTRHRRFDLRMVTAVPPFSAEALAGYQIINRSLQLPFD